MWFSNQSTSACKLRTLNGSKNITSATFEWCLNVFLTSLVQVFSKTPARSFGRRPVGHIDKRKILNAADVHGDVAVEVDDNRRWLLNGVGLNYLDDGAAWRGIVR